MSGMAELSQRLARLTEISGIMTAMKSLSMVETRKLGRFVGHQRRMLANIRDAATDFLTFFPVARTAEIQPAILVLIGSERGFCGNFNERILTAFDNFTRLESVPALLVVGHRLGAKLEGLAYPGVIVRLDGPTVTEDVPTVLSRVMDALHAASRELSGDGVALFTLAHDAEGEPTQKRLLPLASPQPAIFPHPPHLQLEPREFFAEMLDQYLLAALYGLLYESLAAENRQRLAHMEQALNHLDETVARLALKHNALRQEKIVEEIEVILSSEQALPSHGRFR